MSPSDWEIIQEIFHDAMNLAPSERRAFVRSKNLGATLEADLLDMVEATTGPLDRIHDASPPSDGPSLQPGDAVGSYRLIRPIHEGGMGVVFLAERSDDQYQQKVAIKFIRGELALFGLVRRFRVERQILANLNHPYIAKLIDGGVTPAGQAFLVMEYVEGRTLTDASKDLSLEDKLALFLKICNAVQDAHRNLVVHRDLKPANILVNDRSEPKLLDFGIAKVLDSSTEQTATVARAFTPRYASPEQVLGNPVSTLTDVYSLGVILYEMLSGVLPYDAEVLDSTRLYQAIVEQEPRRPSTHVSGMPADLDFIVLKALRKEPALRYGSVAEFAADIQSFLDGRPIAARAPTVMYRTRKFVKRHRPGVIAAAVALCAIFTGIAVTLQQSRVARRERDKALAVSGFLQELIQSGGPDRDRFKNKGVDLRVIDLLDDSAEMLDQNFRSQPEILIEMRRTISVAYLGLGAWDKARRQADLALERSRAWYGERNLTTAHLYHTQGEVMFKQEQHKEAIVSFRRALDLYTALTPSDPMRFMILKNLSSSELNNGQRDEALRDIQVAVAGFRALPGRTADLGLALCDLATVCRQHGNVEMEDKAGKESIDVLHRVSDPPVNLGVCLNNRALFLQDQGRLEEAMTTAKEAVSFTRERVGTANVELAAMLSLEGDLYRAMHRTSEARAAMDEALAVALKIYPRDHEWPQYILFMYGKMQCDPGFKEYGEGVDKLAESLQKRRPNFPPDDLQISAMTFALGRCLIPLNRQREAEPLLLEAIKIRLKRYGKDNASTRRALDLYLQIVEARGQKVSADQAIQLAQK